MSGHLANLLERAAERTPLLQRRRRSLFEPAEGMVDLSTPAAEPAPAPDTDATAAQVAQSATAPTLAPAQTWPLAAQHSDADSAALRPVAQLPQLPAVAAADDASSRRSSQDSTTSMNALPAATMLASPPLAAAPAAATAARRLAAEAPPLRRAAPDAGEQGRPTPPPPREVRRAPHAADSPRAAAAPKPGVLHPTASVEPRLAMAVPPHAPAPSREPALRPAVPAIAALRATATATALQVAPAVPPPPPAVTIHIGRIELRATAPSAAERATRPAAPKLGLADYLRARHGGRP